MSFLHDLKGVRVLPSPALRDGDINGGRFFEKNPNQWPQGYAFGGWIYDAQVSLGFSKRPTQVTLNLVLEQDSSINSIQKFDIKDRLLEVSLITEDGGGGAAANFNDEFWKGHYYTIELHGIKFNRMYLYDYSIAVEASQKTLTVTFKDYSVILDKIYIGLMKRQGPPRMTRSQGDTATNYLCGWRAKHVNRFNLLRQGAIATQLETFCPNCYLMGEGFNNRGLTDPKIANSYGGNLRGFFQRAVGYVQRDSTIGSFIGRPNPNNRSTFSYYDNFVKERVQNRYAASRICYNATVNAWLATGGNDVNGEPWYTQQMQYVTDPRDGSVINCTGNDITLHGTHGGIPHVDFNSGKYSSTSFDKINTIRYPISLFWNDLHKRVSHGEGPTGQNYSRQKSKADFRPAIGFTIDGGHLMIGSEEFAESTCGTAPNVSYNFTELISSLRNRGFTFFTPPTLPRMIDKNPRFRSNYIGTLREVLEQWCGVFGLDYYYLDTGELESQGFYFIDLQHQARIDPIKDVVDPATDIGKEFGATNEQRSVIVSYKESSTLENTYIQSCITSNVRAHTVKERKKTIKRYVPILPLHPCDFSLPNYEMQYQESLLGEWYKYYKIANFIPWSSAPRVWPLEAGWDHRKRMWNRTNREIWDMDVSMALCRFDDNLRDLWVANRICTTALSELCPISVWPAGQSKAGDPILYKQDTWGQLDGPASQQEIDNGVETVAARHGWDPGYPGHCMTADAEADLRANFDALGFESLMEIEDFMVKENLVDLFLSKQELEDVSLDVSHLKMFLGYYDEQAHQQHKEWEKRCAESMYGFGAVFGGTIPAEPFIPRDYYGVREGNLGFDEDSCGISVPKLKNSFEPDAAQYPHYSLEALDAPFQGLLVNSGMYLPTGLHIAKLDNPWGTSVEEYEKAFWRVFEDNACKEFNNSLNVIEDAGFNNIPIYQTDIDGVTRFKGYRKNTDQFPEKKQDWNLGMFTPKFFKNSEKLLQDLQGVIQGLHLEGRLVDEVSVGKRTVEYGEQRYCKKLTLMVITDTRPFKHPNISFNPVFLEHGMVNPMMRRQRELWEVAEAKRKARDDMRNRCDRDLVYEFCENAIQNDHFGIYNSPRAGWNYNPNLPDGPAYPQPFGKAACAVNPTGVYKEGFEKQLIGGYKLPNSNITWQGLPNCRVLQLQLVRNPLLKGFIPTSEGGQYHLEDLEGDMQGLSRRTLIFNIGYPVNNFKMIKEVPGGYAFQDFTAGMVNSIPHQFYSGIWTAEQTLEDRMPELVEIYGSPPGAHNPTAGIRVVNNTIDPDLGAVLDPDAGGFITQIYDNYGQSIQSIEGYHNHIAYGNQWPKTRGALDKGLEDFSVMTPNRKVNLQLAGSLVNFPRFAEYCNPHYGLQDLNISFSDQGVQTSLSFADRPAEAPNMEGILNKIGPRTM